MCGIAGIWRLDGGPVRPERVRRMTRAMHHRGPDDEGYVALDARGSRPPIPLGGPRTAAAARGAPLPYAPPAADLDDPPDYSLVIGQVRLAIIDLSPGGHQPLTNEDGTVWVTFGGEIFNYVELKRELIDRGYRFRSASDTEVLVHGYTEWGEGLFPRLNGMWGLAIWDARRRQLVCARDRLGVKPFYYRYAEGEFAFASELRGIKALGGPATLSRTAIGRLISEGRVDTGQGTFFDEILSLPPAHHAIVGERDLALTRYWDIQPGSPGALGPDRAAEALRELLTDSVRLRLRSDVRVGTCLSGGVDSSSIVSLGTRLLGGPMDAYSVAYDEGPEFDERVHMRAVCEATGARHHLVMPRGEALLDELMAVTEAQEEPTAGPGVYSQWQVMRLAGANGAKVLLDGQGADELFGGYFAFYFPLRMRDLVARGELAGAVSLARAALDRGHSPLEVAARTAEPWIPGALFRRGRRWLGAGDWAQVLAPELRATQSPSAPAGPRAQPPAKHFASHLTARQYEDLQRLLLPSLLRYEDRNSMAFSIEARVPFLDYRLVEIAFALPVAVKFDHGVTKRVLREAMAGIVPASILARTDKRGFETPVVRWLVARHAGWLKQTLLDGRAVERGFLDRRAMAAFLERQIARPRGPGHEVWRLVSLELWLRACFRAGGE
jgi:asparagine synthase (glutamine-hydrolysing)